MRNLKLIYGKGMGILSLLSLMLYLTACNTPVIPVNYPTDGVDTDSLIWNTQAVLDGDLDQFIEASLKSGL